VINHSLLSISASTQDHIQGVLNATVVLVMYGDYQCPQSANVYRLIKTIQKQLTLSLGETYLCFIFRHFPQIQIHPHAQHAAEAVEAAGIQDQFWQMHDMLFTHQSTLENGYLVEYAHNLGLDISQFLQDISRHVYVDRINQDIASGVQSGVTTTPALFINSIRYTDRWSVKRLTTAIIISSQ
jgi:protein-disulfide isomerase